MKVSEIAPEHISQYLKLEDIADNDFLKICLDAAKSYVKSYTGMTEEEMDKHLDIVPVIYVLASDMYDNREYSQRSNKVIITPNIVAKSTLDMYCKNLL